MGSAMNYDTRVISSFISRFVVKYNAASKNQNEDEKVGLRAFKIAELQA
jgi:hypothetical protein